MTSGSSGTDEWSKWHIPLTLLTCGTVPPLLWDHQPQDSSLGNYIEGFRMSNNFNLMATTLAPPHPPPTRISLPSHGSINTPGRASLMTDWILTSVFVFSSSKQGHSILGNCSAISCCCCCHTEYLPNVPHVYGSLQKLFNDLTSPFYKKWDWGLQESCEWLGLSKC